MLNIEKHEYLGNVVCDNPVKVVQVVAVVVVAIGHRQVVLELFQVL